MIIDVKFAESNQTINANFGEVYHVSDGGFEKGYGEGYADGKKDGFNEGFEDGKEQGFEDGKNSVVDLGKLCNQIKFGSLNVFGKSEVILDLDNTTSLTEMFYLGSNNSLLKNTIVEHITLNCKKHITDLYRAFYCYYTNDDTLKRITLNADISEADAFNNVFVGCRTLETIDGTPFDFTNVKQINTPFRNCSALKELRVKPNTIKIGINFSISPNLSTDTIQSIINGLADLTGATTQTLTVHKTVGEKITDEQKAIITAKNWTLAY